MQNVETWLEQVRKLDELINAKLIERDQALDLATKITPEVTDMPHATGVSDKVGDAGVKLADLANEINQLVDQYVDCKKAVVTALEKLPAKEYATLHRHYIRYMTWDDVAADLGVCGMTVWRWRQAGYKNLQNVVECYAAPVV